MPGEFDFIDWIKTQQRKSELVQVPAGDDMAVVRWPADDLLLVAADQVLEGRHFDSKVHSPREIGRKVMNRNLSDCAAMACLPVVAVATVALPRGATMEYAKELYLGTKEAGEKFYCSLIGGDTGTWDGPLCLSLTVLGRNAGVKTMTRHGAKAGDGIYVTGPLGGSILGRHMDFEPRIHDARMVAKSGVVTSMIDISDGLSRDLRHLCVDVGAKLESAKIPIHKDAEELARRDGRSALEHALHDGEDYELLFTATAQPPMGLRIGTIVAEKGGWIDDRVLEAKGWEHQMR